MAGFTLSADDGVAALSPVEGVCVRFIFEGSGLEVSASPRCDAGGRDRMRAPTTQTPPPSLRCVSTGHGDPRIRAQFTFPNYNIVLFPTSSG